MKKSGVVYRHIADSMLRDGRREFVGREIALALGISPNTVNLAIRQLSRIGCATTGKRSFEITNLDKLLTFWAVNRKLENDIAYRTYVPAKGHGEIEQLVPSGVAFTCYSGYSRLFGNDASDYSEVYLYATDAALGAIRERFPERQFSERSDYFNLVVLRPDEIMGRDLLSGVRAQPMPVMPSPTYVNSAVSSPMVPPSADLYRMMGAVTRGGGAGYVAGAGDTTPLAGRFASRSMSAPAVASVSQLYVDLWNSKEWYANEFLKRLRDRMDMQSRFWAAVR